MILGNESLFSAFESLSKQSWKDTAIADLKGADFDKKLVWKTDEGIAVQPFYTAEDLQDIFIPPGKNSLANRSWDNYVEVEVKDLPEAKKFMLRRMEFDVTGFLLNINETESLDFSMTEMSNDLVRNFIAINFNLP